MYPSAIAAIQQRERMISPLPAIAASAERVERRQLDILPPIGNAIGESAELAGEAVARIDRGGDRPRRQAVADAHHLADAGALQRRRIGQELLVESVLRR